MRMVTYQEGAFRFEGCVSVADPGNWVSPWRIVHSQLELFKGLISQGAADCAGVRLSFSTDSGELALFLEAGHPDLIFDLFVDGLLLQELVVNAFDDQAYFSPLPPGEKIVEIWVDHRNPLRLKGLGIDDQATLEPVSSFRQSWIHYGGSQGLGQEIVSPSMTWTGQLAGRLGLNLTNLSFKGPCRFESSLALLIRDYPVDFITVLLEGGTAEEYFNLPGWFQIIREKQPQTPLAIITPLVEAQRQRAEEVVAETIGFFEKNGDTALFGISGAEFDCGEAPLAAEAFQRQLALFFEQRVFSAKFHFCK